jgi:DNA-binding beta-propeller fold protein YncE
LRRHLTDVLLVGTLAVGFAGVARAQDAGDLDERVRGLERKIDRVERKLDRLIGLLEGKGDIKKDEKPLKEADVPNAVFGAFKKAHPSADATGWVQSGDRYVVSIVEGGKRLSLAFAEDGTLVGTKTAELPKNADFTKEKEIALPGEGSWDYVTAEGGRLYVAHLTAIDVIDLAKGEKVGEVKGIDGAHGIAIVPDVKRGFATSGRNNKLLAFDTETLQVVKEIETGTGPDCCIYVASQGEVWAMNHKGGTISCVDPKTLDVKKTIEVGGTLEFAREDAEKSLVYVNVEDKDLLVTIDAKKHEVAARYATAPGKAPAGLALDAKDGLLFIGCENKTCVVMEAATGKVVASLASGEHCDGCAFDPATGNAVASCRENSWAFHVKDAHTVDVLGALEAGKTCTLDPRTHRIYITAGKRGEKDSVKVLVYSDPHAPATTEGTRTGSGRRPPLVERMREAVGLTDDQVAKVKSLNEQLSKDLQALRQGEDRSGRAQKTTALIGKMRDDIRTFLTEEQKPKFEAFVKKEDEDFAAGRNRNQNQNQNRRRGDSEEAPQPSVAGHPDKTIALGTGGFDYLVPNVAGRKLYLAHSSKLDVIDMDKDEKVAEIEGVDGAHGTAIAADAGRGFATASRKQKLIAFDLATNKVLKEIDTDQGPDAAIFASSVGEAWSINHRAGTVTCVDAKTLEVTKTVEVGGTLEYAAEIGDRVFVNVEDRNVVAVIDAKKHEVVSRYETAPGTGPAGLASDAAHGLVFAGCHNKKLVALDAATGKVVATFDIGQGCDAVAFDAGTNKVYASCGDGTTTVVEVKDKSTFGTPKTIDTARGGKCCAVDSKTHKLYVAVAPRRNEQGESKVLVFLPEGSKAPD